ncbi:MAG: hypothetical protein AAF202_10230 [Pseudomonadota bacterium]
MFGKDRGGLELKPLLRKVDELDLTFTLKIEYRRNTPPWPYISASDQDANEVAIVEAYFQGFNPGGAPMYETHIVIGPENDDFYEEYAGRGLGSGLYVMMAAIVSRLNGELYSSQAPMPEAELAWERMSAKGWAVDQRPTASSSDGQIESYLLRRLRPFRVSQTRLKNGFFESALLPIYNLEDLEDVEAWLELNQAISLPPE